MYNTVHHVDIYIYMHILKGCSIGKQRKFKWVIKTSGTITNDTSMIFED